jgi:Ca2+-binding RTX toxin-like protein
MAFQSRLIRCLLLCALLAALLAVAVGVSSAAGARPAPKPYPTQVPVGPRCLGKVATIVGQGTIHGTAHADVIVAGGGADDILGGGGNDRICAGGGNDTIEGGPGSDKIEAGAGADEVVGDNGSDFVLAGTGSDTVFGKRGNDQIDGGPGTDFLDSGLGDDTLDGGPGNGDEVIGGIGTDRLSGGPGDGDVLEGDLGVDTLDGGPGAHDVASYALAGQGGVFYDGFGVTVDLSAGTAYGDGDDTLTGIEDVVGTPFADKIVGDAEPNDLYGGGGIDDLSGVGPGDTAFGGTGLDRCRAVQAADSCELSGAGALEATGEAVDRELHDGQRPPPSFEVDLPGGAGTGALTGIVEHGSNLLVKQGMQVHASFLEGAWVLAEQGLPMAVGEGCTLLSPETARCPLSTTPTGLFLDGSEGADLLAVEPSVPATVSARMIGGNGVDTLIGGAGDDNLDATRGLPEGDTVYGGPGDDALTDGSILGGGAGSDLLIALPCGETIVGGPGVDSVSFARSDRGVEATLGGTAGLVPEDNFAGGCPAEHPFQPPASQIDSSVERIEGSPNDDILTGDGAENVILGRGGDDEVHGAGGDDFLVGGDGVDALYGEGGADRLYARDGRRDGAIDCGSAGPSGPAGREDSVTRGDVAVADPGDPPARDCGIASPWISSVRGK